MINDKKLNRNSNRKQIFARTFADVGGRWRTFADVRGRCLVGPVYGKRVENFMDLFPWGIMVNLCESATGSIKWTDINLTNGQKKIYKNRTITGLFVM